MFRMTPSRSKNNTVVFGLRLTNEEATRLAQLARHCGMTRPAFVRSAVALADSMLTVGELDQMATFAPLTGEKREAQRRAQHRMDEITAALRPMPLITPAVD